MKNQNKIGEQKSENLKKIYIVAGPTSSGKSDYAVKLAKEINGEIISADSRQIYKYLDIGSGKITKIEMQNIVHYGLGVVEPKYLENTDILDYKNFTVANWLKYAEEKIIEIRNKNKTPIICGGTGLYIDALLYGITDNPSPNLEIRKELEKINIDTQISKQEKIIILQNIIKNLNLEYFISLNNSEKNNTERLIRKIEILKQNNNTININHEKVLRYDVNFILIDPDIDTLKNNIKIRLEKRLYPVGDFAKSENYNLIDEVKNLIENKKVDPEWLQSLGLEYKYTTMYVKNEITKQEMCESIINQSIKYAKRQKTWNKRYANLLNFKI